MNPAVSTLLILLGATSLVIVVQADLCTDGVVIGNTCYRLPYRAGPRINFQRAKDLCHFHGGVLAEIPTESVYLGVFKYVKRSWYFEANTNHVEVWTGAELNDAGSGVAYLAGGGKSYLTWNAAHKVPFSGHTKLVFGVPTSPKTSIQRNGMLNVPSTYKAVPLCQFILD